jgi:hypothetical protein
MAMGKVHAPAKDAGRQPGDRHPRWGARVIGWDQRFARIRHTVTGLHAGTDRSWTEPWARHIHNPAFIIQRTTAT